MIVLFAYKSYKNWIDLLYFLKHYYPDCVILTRPDRYYFEKADVIIPISIKCQKELNKYREFKHKILTASDEVYDTLDDKINFYKFINKYNLLEGLNIKLINTYGNDYDGPNIHGKFIVKHRNGIGSAKNKVAKGKIKKIIRMFPNYQIQDLLNVNHINCVSCLCKNGSIISSLNFIVPEFISNKLYKKSHELLLKRPDSDFLELVTRIIEITNYSGLIELEFLVDNDGRTYLIECNPRLSGTVRCISNKNDVPYVSNLINPYVNLFSRKQFDTRHYIDNSQLKYNGNFKHPDYYISSDGKMHFTEH